MSDDAAGTAGSDLITLADTCQEAADEIAARLSDFDHPLNQAFQQQLLDQQAKLRICAHALRLQAIDEIAAAGTDVRERLDEATGIAKAAVARITAVENSVALVGALLQLGGAIAVAVASRQPAGIVAAANNLISVAKPLVS